MDWKTERIFKRKKWIRTLTNARTMTNTRFLGKLDNMQRQKFSKRVSDYKKINEVGESKPCKINTLSSLKEFYYLTEERAVEIMKIKMLEKYLIIFDVIAEAETPILWPPDAKS